MEIDFGLIEKACVLVTLTFVLTRTRVISHLMSLRLPVREQGLALLVFLVMASMEEAVAGHHSSMNVRIVAICAAGLLAGPWIGCIVGAWATLLACYYHPEFSPITIGLSMVLSGLAGGLIHRWRPVLALNPAVGFGLGMLTQLLRYALALAFAPILHTLGSAKSLPTEMLSALLQGSGVALVLLVVAQVHHQQLQARAAAMAEVRALQARMNPHFLFNALNTLSALSLIDPRTVPRAAARLGHFLRASLDQHERPLIRLHEELDIVRAYLEVEILRLGDRLSVHLDIEPEYLEACVPPFLLQPLVENAVQHGIQSCSGPGRISLKVHAELSTLLLVVSDTGPGISSKQRARLFLSDGTHAHALSLLRRRLDGLYGSNFLLTVESTPGQGTTVSVRIPLETSPASPAPERWLPFVTEQSRPEAAGRIPLLR